jgi:antitoxin CcdA
VYVLNGRLSFTAPDRIDNTYDLAGAFVIPPFAEAHNHDLTTDFTPQERIDEDLHDGGGQIRRQIYLPCQTVPTSADASMTHLARLQERSTKSGEDGRQESVFSCAFHMRVIMRSASERRSSAMPRPAAASTKKSVNLSLRADLLARAKRARINLSAVLDRAVSQELAQLEQRRWLEENKEAFNAYNDRIEKHGLFSDGRRGF